MKPLPAPTVPGKTEFERFDNAMRQVLRVSKVGIAQAGVTGKESTANKEATEEVAISDSPYSNPARSLRTVWQEGVVPSR
jgi:hypothetical protein